jgi:hypothetical protein
VLPSVQQLQYREATANDITSISWDPVCKNFTQLGWCADFYVLLFAVVYPVWCDFATDPTKEQQRRNGTRLITGDESLIYGYDSETKQQSSQWKIPNSPTPKEARQLKSKVNSMFIIFFDIKRTVHKEFVLVGQTANSAYYCDDLLRLCESVRRLRTELWQQKNWLLKHDKTPSLTSFFTREFLTKNNMTVVHCPPYLFSVPTIEDNSERLSFWHNWGGRGRTAGGAVHLNRTRLLGRI